MKRIAIFADASWNSPQQGAATDVLQMPRAVRPVSGPVHKMLKVRWLADAQGYRNKSKVPGQLLDPVNNGWSRIGVIR